ncbi:MAG: class I adenylate-forming enzyme family protein [Nitriliruptorales bacterium]
MTAELPVALDLEPLVHRATGLLCRLGLHEGDRVLTLLLNSPDALALGLACQLAGVVQVPLYPDLPPREAAEIVADAAPHAAIIGSDVPAHARHHLLVPPVVGDNPGSAPAPRTISPGRRPHLLDPGGLALERAVAPAASWPRTRPMAYTSGTTGRRKGVHVGVRDEAWGREVVLDEYRAFEERHGGTHLVVSPLPHSGPFRFAFVTAFLGGRVAVLPRFDPDLLRETLRSVRPTSFFCVPTQLHRLMSLPATTRDDLASLTLLAHAGARCPARLKERVLELAPEGSVWEFYGSTEGQFSVCPPRVWQEAPGTVGRARPDRRLEIRDGHTTPSASSATDVPDTGRPAPRPSSRRSGRSLPAGKVGTVWVRAPEHASWHYWRNPRRTTAAWDGDAFTVGDLGRLDEEGRLFLEGRPGDLVISGGVNIYPAEVERWLLEYPAVAEAVVFGVPDEEWGERLVAAVIPRRGCHLTPEGLREHCREGLHRAKVPKQVFVVDDLPRTVTGKLSRAGLAQALGLLTG